MLMTASIPRLRTRSQSPQAAASGRFLSKASAAVLLPWFLCWKQNHDGNLGHDDTFGSTVSAQQVDSISTERVAGMSTKGNCL